MLRVLPKPTFEEFINTCTPFYKIPQLETEIKTRIQTIIANLLNFTPSQDPTQNLIEFLKRDRNFIGVILSLSNLSQEKFLRIISAKRFAEGTFDTEWGINKIQKQMQVDNAFVEDLAKMFIEGSDNELLKEIVPDFYLDQLYLPPQWTEIIRDQNVVGNIVRKKLAGAYTDAKGDYIERLLESRIDQISSVYGITREKGQVQLMGLGKEVDIALPTLADPYILIMVSYMETTSSGQTIRANEQNEMYVKIVHENVRYPTKRILINFVDGAGWLARLPDLRKIFNGCHYCININTIDQLEPIILKYLPKRYFTLREPPIVEE